MAVFDPALCASSNASSCPRNILANSHNIVSGTIAENEEVLIVYVVSVNVEECFREHVCLFLLVMGGARHDRASVGFGEKFDIMITSHSYNKVVFIDGKFRSWNF